MSVLCICQNDQFNSVSFLNATQHDVNGAHVEIIHAFAFSIGSTAGPHAQQWGSSKEA